MLLALIYHGLDDSNLPISFRFTSLALGQSYDCPSAHEVTLKDMGKTKWYITSSQHKVCTFFMGYTPHDSHHGSYGIHHYIIS